MTRVDGRLVGERITYEVTGKCAGWVRIGDTRVELHAATDSFFRNHSWGYQAGRGGPRLYGAPSAAKKRLPGVRQWVLFDMPDHGGYYFLDPSGRKASGQGAIMLADRVVAGDRGRARPRLLRRRPAAARRDVRAHRRRGGRAQLRGRRPRAGSTTRAAATSAASTTGSGRASTAASCTSRARRGTSPTPRRSSTRRAARSSSTTPGPRTSPGWQRRRRRPRALRVRRHPAGRGLGRPLIPSSPPARSIRRPKIDHGGGEGGISRPGGGGAISRPPVARPGPGRAGCRGSTSRPAASP